MKYEITIALIASGSALLGAIVGGLSTYLSNSKIKKIEWNQLLKKEEIDEKKKLYSEFLAETNRLQLTSIKEKTNEILEFTQVGNFIAQMQLISVEFRMIM